MHRVNESHRVQNKTAQIRTAISVFELLCMCPYSLNRCVDYLRRLLLLHLQVYFVLLCACLAATDSLDCFPFNDTRSTASLRKCLTGSLSFRGFFFFFLVNKPSDKLCACPETQQDIQSLLFRSTGGPDSSFLIGIQPTNPTQTRLMVC